MLENKPINTCEFFDICEIDCSGALEDAEICSCYELYKQLTRKTQECEELKNIINEAKNSGLDLKSFLISEAIQEEYEGKIEKLKASKEQAEQKLEKIRNFMLYEFSGENEWVKKQILQIIDEVK